MRSGLFPVLRRRSYVTFRHHAKEWMSTVAASRIRASTKSMYEWLLDDQLLPAFGERALGTITSEAIHAYAAAERERLAPKTVNYTLALLREILEAADEWGRLPANPARKLRRLAVPRREMRVWTLPRSGACSLPRGRRGARSSPWPSLRGCGSENFKP